MENYSDAVLVSDSLEWEIQVTRGQEGHLGTFIDCCFEEGHLLQRSSVPGPQVRHADIWCFLQVLSMDVVQMHLKLQAIYFV